MATADAYLFGPSLLVAPIFEAGATERKIYLPEGGWYDFWTGRRVEGGRTTTAAAKLETMPLFVRAGSLLPTGPIRQYVSQPSSEPVKVTVYPGADGRFAMYEDDGATFAYEHEAYTVVDLQWNDAERTLRVSVRGGGHLPAKEMEVAVLGGESRKITPVHAAQTLSF